MILFKDYSKEISLGFVPDSESMTNPEDGETFPHIYLGIHLYAVAEIHV